VNHIRPLIVGNWKMNTTLTEALILAGGIKEGLGAGQLTGIDVVICPPFPWIVSVAEALRHHPQPHLTVGAQNLFWKDAGAYTGEVAAPMLAGLAHYAILGHSERRRHFHETDQEIAEKVKLAIDHKIKPIICVGEKKKGANKEAINQLEAVLAKLTKDEREAIVVAYEPVWAISGNGGEASTGLYAQNMAEKIRELLSDETPILYGGSVDSANAREFLSQRDIDGVLVGGASLKTKEFLGICRAAVN
jgi:triosephosphate isomerase